MGKKSIKENKNNYQNAREAIGMTRASAAEASKGRLTESRIEKIENGTAIAYAEDVKAMAEIYNRPELCNYFCSHECAIGKNHVPAINTIHELPQTTMGLLSKLNSLNDFKNRIIDITADGKISDDEKVDFEKFKTHILEMSSAIEELRLWAEKELE